MDMTVLVVEDETSIREMLVDSLARAGFQPLEAAKAFEAERIIADSPPHLILLDWMLPEISGIDLARRLQKSDATRDIPVIMLTARGEERDKLRGFEAGVDDYVSKPFSVRELLARVNAVLRRATTSGREEAIEAEGIRLDPVSHRVSVNGQVLKMGPTEFRLLRVFMSHRDRAFSRSQLLDRVWGPNVYIEDRTVDVHIRRLRKALPTRLRSSNTNSTRNRLPIFSPFVAMHRH